MQIGAHYEPNSVLGVDIDAQMIKAAIGNLHRLVNAEEVKKELQENGQPGEEQDNMQMLTDIE